MSGNENTSIDQTQEGSITKPKVLFALFYIILGGVISFGASFTTPWILKRNEKINKLNEKRLEVSECIVKSINERNYSAFNMYRAARDSNMQEYKQLKTEYRKSRKTWNINIPIYMAQLSYYYDERILNSFKLDVYQPSIDFGNDIYYENFPDSLDVGEQYLYLGKQNSRFCLLTYDYVDK